MKYQLTDYSVQFGYQLLNWVLINWLPIKWLLIQFTDKSIINLITNYRKNTS